ncbi:MAG: hypothetical protein LQ341_002883 [Variospora aurantia]|nr:MAG: hypothetical protein LQ341_002883 [Variospora aurantia]
MLFALPPRLIFSLVLFSLLSLNAMAMQIIATDDLSSTGPEYELNINFPMSEKSYKLDHLTDRSTITELTVEGTIVVTTPTNVDTLRGSDIAYINCDRNAIEGDLETAISRTPSPVAVILYSLNRSRCSLSPDNYPFPAMYSMKDKAYSTEVLEMLQSNTTLMQNSTISPPDGDGGSGGILGRSPTTAVAMIILYSITGIITALFLIIIVVGAIRAHRHPERYGPRNIIGRPRQSRAKGIARAMLETIPVVKFGDHQDSKPSNQPGDIEMAPSQTVPDTAVTAAASANNQASAPAEPRGPAEGSSDAVVTEQTPERENHPQPTDDLMANADNGLACSVCTDDFAKGQDVRVLPCNHKFHPECIDPWLLNVSGTCPLCRVDLRPTTTNDGDPEDPNAASAPRRNSEALTSFNPSAQQQSRRSSRARPLHYLHHHLNRGRMEEATPQERLEALRRLRLVSRSDMDNAAPSAGGEASVTGERTNRNRLSARLSRAFGGDRSRPSSWTPDSPVPAVPETRNEPLENSRDEVVRR